jgi:hypothetical protein
LGVGAYSATEVLLGSGQCPVATRHWLRCLPPVFTLFLVAPRETRLSGHGVVVRCWPFHMRLDGPVRFLEITPKSVLVSVGHRRIRLYNDLTVQGGLWYERVQAAQALVSRS